MLNRVLGLLVVVLLLTAGPAAQETTPKPSPTTKAPPATEQAATAPGQPANVKLDLTITDDMTPDRPAKRTVTMIVADGQRGSIRSIGNQVQARLFVDANPQILSNGNVRVSLGLEYNPRQTPTEKIPQVQQVPVFPGESAPTGGSSLNQQITVILQPEKPLVISQASDPVSDRKITVEVRASVLK